MAKVVDIVNLTGTELTDINAGGIDIPPYGRVNAVTLTDAEFGTAFNTLLCVMMKSTASEVQARFAAKMLKRTSPYGAVQASPSLDQGT